MPPAPETGKKTIPMKRTSHYASLLTEGKPRHVKRQELQYILREVGKIYCCHLEEQILQNARWLPTK